MKKKIIIISVGIIIVAGISLQLASNKKKIEAKKEKIVKSTNAIPVNIITTNLENIPEKLKKTGTLIPSKEADISSVGSGKLTKVNFELGDRILKGSVLALVDIKTYQLQLEAARLQSKQSKRDFERYKALLKGNAATTLDFQNAQLNYEKAKNKVKQLENKILDNKIIAPISGQITLKEKEQGEFVAMGNTIGHMVNTYQLKVEVLVSESQVYTLKNNEIVTIRTDVYPSHIFKGKITFISNKSDAVHNYRVEITVKNESEFPLKAGSFAYVQFQGTVQKNILLIPKSALIQSLDHPMVYIVDNGKAKKIKITVGTSFGNKIEVLKGLKPYQQVITSGLINISDGTAVQPIKSTNKTTHKGG